MKKFQFHLGKLLSYKDQNLENEMMILAAFNKQLEEEQKRLLELKSDQENCNRNFEKEMSVSIIPEACQVYLRYLSFLKEQIKLILKKIKAIAEKIDVQIEIVKNLKLETRSLEIIKETRYNEYKIEMVKESEKELEEFMVTAKIINESF
ncbi:MAG: flagellar FliJ family protein [Eubacteriaceae bacterium]|nr:flagellar FliJ family protein [Eubacteriaceae bacterium]